MNRTTVMWGVATLVALAVVRPWTVRPLDHEKPAAFDAGSYAQSVWPRVLDEAVRQAVVVSSQPPVATGSSAKARFVKGSGVVTVIDRTSRVGLLRVQLSGTAASTVAIQMGPVIRGTTLRDAVSFIQFSNFTNQFDYAAAANALNDHVLRTVVTAARVDALQGRTIDFVGATSQTAAPGTPIEVVPVAITVLEAGRS